MTNDASKKIAIIGTGNIAYFHVPAMRAVGLDCLHCAARPHSTSTFDFANSHNIQHVWQDPQQLAAAHNDWDAIVIAAAIEPTMKLLDIAASSGKPVLVEKPVSLSTAALNDFASDAPENVIVAYNRRFYNTVQAARDFVSSRAAVRATMTLPDNVSADQDDPYYLVHENSVHGLDILNFVFGPLSIEHIAHANEAAPYFGRHVLLRAEAGHFVSLSMNWRAPANFTLSIDDAAERLDLFPFEKMQRYAGMDVIEPSDEYPVRQYVPNMIESATVFDAAPADIKPGFFGQYSEFARLIDGHRPCIAANLNDAYHAQKLAENIVGGLNG